MRSSGALGSWSEGGWSEEQGVVRREEQGAVHLQRWAGRGFREDPAGPPAQRSAILPIAEVRAKASRLRMSLSAAGAAAEGHQERRGAPPLRSLPVLSLHQVRMASRTKLKGDLWKRSLPKGSY